MKRVISVAAIAALAAVFCFFHYAKASPEPYQGSRFSDVWNLVSEDPYAVLPDVRVTTASFFDVFQNRLLQASERTLSDRSDVLPAFKKLVHPTGVCLAGTWTITEDSPYTGYFRRGKRAQIIARASSALGESKRGEARSFGFAGKLYPTDDPNHQAPLETANFFTIENLSGTYTPHFVDAEHTNDILYLAPRPGALFRGVLGAVAIQAFAQADETLDLTRPFVRQLYPIAQLGEPEGAAIRAPRWLKIVGSSTTERVDTLDYREELDVERHDEAGLHFDIFVADVGTRIGPKEWIYLGDIAIEDSVASDSCDHRLHFAHPPWRE